MYTYVHYTWTKINWRTRPIPRPPTCRALDNGAELDEFELSEEYRPPRDRSSAPHQAWRVKRGLRGLIRMHAKIYGCITSGKAPT